jgi:hypothetical protein
MDKLFLWTNSSNDEPQGERFSNAILLNQQVGSVCFQTGYLNSDRFEFIQSFPRGIVRNDSPLFVIKPFPGILPEQMIQQE